MTAAPTHGASIGSAGPPEGCTGSLSRIASSRTDNEPPGPAAIRPRERWILGRERGLDCRKCPCVGARGELGCSTGVHAINPLRVNSAAALVGKPRNPPPRARPACCSPGRIAATRAQRPALCQDGPLPQVRADHTVRQPGEPRAIPRHPPVTAEVPYIPGSILSALPVCRNLVAICPQHLRPGPQTPVRWREAPDIPQLRTGIPMLPEEPFPHSCASPFPPPLRWPRSNPCCWRPQIPPRERSHSIRTRSAERACFAALGCLWPRCATTSGMA